MSVKSKIEKMEQAERDVRPLATIEVDLGAADPCQTGKPYVIHQAALPALLKVYGQDEQQS
jgi:hypothetical protein